MRRSEINSLIREAEQFFAKMQFRLPPWAHWPAERWSERGAECREIFENMLGWDLTDFGSGEFLRTGLLLFTIRNGNFTRGDKPYAEKIMIVQEGQETPMHFHWNKMEDIINRGGGNLVLELYRAAPDESLSDEPIEISTDGVKRNVPAGGTVVLGPGESITLEPRVYHRFYGEPGAGTVLVGEVSMVNDDRSDNRFYRPIGRFPEILEDEQPYRLLVNDYAAFTGADR